MLSHPVLFSRQKEKKKMQQCVLIMSAIDFFAADVPMPEFCQRAFIWK